MSATSESVTASRLAVAPDCTICLPADGQAVVAGARARVFSLDDPLRLALHAGPVSGALAALTLRNAPTLLSHARGIAHLPARWRPRSRVVLRVEADQPEALDAPAPGPGVAPPLPATVPADVRRALAGRRQVVVAHGHGRPSVTLATWGAGFALSGPGGEPVLVDGPASVAVDAGLQERSVGLCGIVLHGRLVDGCLEAVRATWWRGVEQGTVDVPTDTTPGVSLPD